MSMLIIMPVNANAVENGTDAKNDFNAVAIDGGGSGFLYAPRIVLTVAHSLEAGFSKEDIRIVGYPGQLTTINKYPITWPAVKSVKTFYAPGFKPRTQSDWSRIDDFAVIVLERPMEMKNKVRIATIEDVKRYKENNTLVHMIGYGRQQDRRNPDQQGSVNIYPNEMISKILNDQGSNTIKQGLPPGVIFSSDINFEQRQGQASTCDGDSGAGWFVEENGYRVYLGAQSSGWGMSNCGHHGLWDPNGAMSGISGAYKFMDLIKEAEQYIKDHPYNEPQTKQLDKKSTTNKILCVKNKTKKYLNATKCPKGYALTRKK